MMLTRAYEFRRRALWAAAAIVFLAAAGGVGRADIINGDFSAGLTGWTVSDSTYVNVVAGQAVMSENPLDTEVLLYQDFTIPTGATALKFTLVTLTTEPDIGFLPDGFGAALLDPVGLTSLVPTVDAFTDSFYIRDLVDGVTEGEAASGVGVSPSASSLPLTITLDISGIASGTNARILFRLIGGGVSFNASVTLDNVGTSGGSPPPGAVPEPASVALGLAGLAVALPYARHRAKSRRSRSAA